TLEVPVVIDSTPPQVTIAAPLGGASIDPRLTLPVTVNATDFIGVAQVSLTATLTPLVGTAFSETRTVTPAVASRSEIFQVPFASLPSAGGSLTLSATARDGAGNQGTTNVVVSVQDVVPPSMLSISPAAGAIDVDPASSIVVRFSEAVARATVTTTS